jgi:predicted nucleic acid-binding protein
VASDDAPFGGRVVIADKSAWERASDPRCVASWTAALRAGQIATCAPAAMEILYSARDARHFDDLDDALTALREVPLTRAVSEAARAAMRSLAHRGHHRLPLPDYLIAACAQEAGLGVLHEDTRFEVLARVLSFESIRLLPRTHDS